MVFASRNSKPASLSRVKRQLCLFTLKAPPGSHFPYPLALQATCITWHVVHPLSSKGILQPLPPAAHLFLVPLLSLCHHHPCVRPSWISFIRKQRIALGHLDDPRSLHHLKILNPFVVLIVDFSFLPFWNKV